MAHLYFYYSAMNAGKSTALLQANFNYLERGMTTKLFIPESDTRSAGKITSRIGLEADAHSFDVNFDFLQYFTGITVDCVFIDETQFLTKRQVIQLTNLVDIFNIPVLCYGLRTNFLREPFLGSKYLLALADNLVEIKTVCHCGKKATCTLRIDSNGAVDTGFEQEFGGNDRYVSVCRRHHKLQLTK